MKKMSLFSPKNAIKTSFIAIGFLVTAAFSAHAAVIQSTGSGSAVSTADAVAHFENMAALNGNPYVENGIIFSRTGLSFNNNGCGYAGCPGGFPFTGNYMYGAGQGGYFQITAQPGQFFQGLEFLVGSGFGQSAPINFLYESSLNGIKISSGSGTVSSGTVLGFSDALGFDSLLYTSSGDGITTSDTTFNVPAFDDVRVQYVQTSQAVPEPTTVALLGLGLFGFAASRRKSAKNKNV